MGIARAKIQLAAAENGKSLVKVHPVNSDEYWFISDGKTRWSDLPGQKQYSEEEAASVAPEGEEEQADRGTDGPPVARIAWEAIPKIATLIKQAQSLNTTRTVTLKLADGKVTWPAIDIQDKPDANGLVTIAELVMAPDRPVLGRMVWAEMRNSGKGKSTERMSVEFNQFSLGEPVSDDLFAFDPPKKAKLVEDLVIPGQPGSALLNHGSPDFEARSLAGEKVSLSDFRGKS